MLEYCAPSTNGQARQKKLQKATNTNWFALAAAMNKPHAFLGTGTWPTTFEVNPKAPCFIETALPVSTHFQSALFESLFAPSSITYHAGIGDENQLQVLPAGQQKFEQTPNSLARKSRFFGESAKK